MNPSADRLHSETWKYITTVIFVSHIRSTRDIMSQTTLFPPRKIRERFSQSFTDALAKLNEDQRKAVLQIDGPVMVIAGPGTGKTQILSVRIGQILNETDAQAHNILCLTFTDAAVIAMRSRLVEIIGPEAHKVHIYTFHGFCNQVIQENLDIFGNYRQLEHLSDLEKVDVYKEIIDALPQTHRLKRLKSVPYFEAKRLANLFDMMKRENLTESEIISKVDEYLTRRLENKDDKDLYYARKYKDNPAGSLKQKKWEELNNKMSELKAAAGLFDQYKSILDRMGRYDYNDMITWVLWRFEQDEHLLATYQERYQYFLVDEYQDTNGSQKRILELLISFWEDSPNAFIVGDDDQAIYRFQGANMKNIEDFQDQYQPEVVVLKNNYRSNQLILDLSKSLIELNQERIINHPALQLEKDLIASHNDVKLDKTLPAIRVFTNLAHEEAWIIQEIERLYAHKSNLDDVAIIYRNHSQVDKITSVLEKKGIPINVKRKMNILKHPLIENILNILHYIQEEYNKPNSAERRLFEILHYDFLGIDSSDAATIAIECRSAYSDSDQTSEGGKLEWTIWNNVISDLQRLKKLNCKQPEKIVKTYELLQLWLSNIANTTLQQLFENVINDGNILKTIFNHPDSTWLLQVVSTLFDLIKQETTKNPSLKLGEFLEMIDKMNEHDIPLQINKVVSNKFGVHFITAHSAKGLEFDKVYMIGCTKNIWDNKKGNQNNYSYPDNINEDVDANDEDERRLFYVAMTRAKTNLHISFATQNDNGKPLSKSQFVDEVGVADQQNIGYRAISQEVSDEVMKEFQYQSLLKLNKSVQLIDKDLIDRTLSRYKLSVTGLNKYLKCPMSFYFETILKVPTARNKYMGFGRAMHRALEMYYDAVNKKTDNGADTLIEHFRIGMKHHKSHFTDLEYKDMTFYGEQILTAYFEKNIKGKSHAKSYELESKIKDAHYKHVPIKGVLDRVDILDHGVEVTDYKTGNYAKTETRNKLKQPNEKNPLGGDYWRQIVFYKLLLDSDKKHNWSMTTGYVDFIEPKPKTSEFSTEKFVIKPDHLKIVGDQIEDTWNKIQDHDFNHLCSEKHCYWCDFVRNDYVFSEQAKQDMVDDDDHEEILN